MEPMPTNSCLVINNLSKKFCRDLKASMWYGLSDITRSSLGLKPHTTRLRDKEFWAVKNVSLQLNKGDMVGVIGHNGSGKTTLLRMLAQILTPDEGEAMIRGRLVTLLTVGAGFHPHFTVRENIYINGTILGLSRKEIDANINEILAFSGIADHVDAPVAALSDGMYVRLGFSIAMVLKPDIFLIDEVLAVSDKEFRKKCVDALKKISLHSAALFVSHNLDLVQQICNRIIVMQNGSIVFRSDNVDEGIEWYQSTRVN